MKKIVAVCVMMVVLTVSSFAQAPKDGYVVFDGTAGIGLPITLAGWPELSIEGWFKFDDSLTWRWVFGTGPDFVNVGMSVNQGDSIIRYHFSTTDYESWTGDGKTLLEPGKWYHIAIVYDGETFKGFLNGELDIKENYTGRVKITSPKYAIGAGNWSNDEIFLGSIDEIRIWNRAITQTEIRDNMNKELNGNENGLKHYYKCNDGKGDTLIDTASGKHGLIKSGVKWVGAPQQKTNTPSNTGSKMPFGN